MNILEIKDTYEELQKFRKYREREDNLESIESMKKLENDVDLPIKTIVGMFALMGCQPLFSCCGFDYHEQPVHKTHEYGNAYVMLNNNENTKQLIGFLVEKKFLVSTVEKTSQWRTWKIEKDRVVFVALAFNWEESNRDYPWTKTNCVHYAEKGVIGLHLLRKGLYTFKDVFLDKIVLSDTNQRHNKNLAYWQYPGLDPWEISKKEMIEQIEEEIA